MQPPLLAWPGLTCRRDLCPRRLILFRLTARRDAKAAKAFLKQALETVRLYRPVSICTDKAPGCRKVIQELNHSHDPNLESIGHIDRKYRNNRIESDHAALKRLPGIRQSFRTLASAKATPKGVETIRTIKNGHIETRLPAFAVKLRLSIGCLIWPHKTSAHTKVATDFN